MPKKLLDEIDVEAELDNRSRSNWIVTELQAAVGMRRKMASTLQAVDFEGAGEKSSAGVGGPSSSSTRAPHAPPEPKGNPRINEAPVAADASSKSSAPRVARARNAHEGMTAREKGTTA